MARETNRLGPPLALQSLAQLVEERDPLHGVLANIDAIAAAALGRRRSYQRRDGSVIEAPDPDHGTVLRAMEVGAKVLSGNRRWVVPPEWSLADDFEKMRELVAKYDAMPQGERERLASTRSSFHKD